STRPHPPAQLPLHRPRPRHLPDLRQRTQSRRRRLNERRPTLTLVFLDTETTGLADDCDIWEIGLIARTPRPDDVDDALGDMAEFIDSEYRWLIRPNLYSAEPTGLRIGRYYSRIGNLAPASVGYAWCYQHPDAGERS